MELTRLAAEQHVLSSPGCRMDILPDKMCGLIIICSIAAHAGPRGSVQPVAEHHPSTSATECGYRPARPRDGGRSEPGAPTSVQLHDSLDSLHSSPARGGFSRTPAGRPPHGAVRPSIAGG